MVRPLHSGCSPSVCGSRVWTRPQEGIPLLSHRGLSFVSAGWQFSCQTSSVSSAWAPQPSPPQRGWNHKEAELFSRCFVLENKILLDLQSSLWFRWFLSRVTFSCQWFSPSSVLSISSLTSVIQTVSYGRLYLLFLRQSACIRCCRCCCVIWCILVVSWVSSMSATVACRHTHTHLWYNYSNLRNMLKHYGWSILHSSDWKYQRKHIKFFVFFITFLDCCYLRSL